MIQRPIFAFCFGLFFLLSGCSGFGGAKKSVSVSFSPEKYNTLAVLVEQSDFGRIIEDAFVMGLMNKGYSVVSRNDVQQLIGEIQFQGSGLTQSDRVKLGQMLNVRGILMVHLTKAYSETHDSSYTDRKGQYHSGSYTVHNAGIDARLIDVENGSIQWVSSYASGGLADLDLFGAGDLHGTVQGVAERVIESLPDRFKKPSQS
jgi:hypothetical protein